MKCIDIESMASQTLRNEYMHSYTNISVKTWDTTLSPENCLYSLENPQFLLLQGTV